MIIKELFKNILQLPDENATKEMLRWLTIFNKTMVRAGKGAIGSSMGNDDLFPLTIVLLPDDKNELEKIKNHLSFFQPEDNTDENSFHVTNLFSAIDYKLTINAPTPADEAEKLKLAVEEFKMEEKIVIFIESCIKAMDEIIDPVIKKLGIKSHQMEKLSMPEKYSVLSQLLEAERCNEENDNIKSDIVFQQQEDVFNVKGNLIVTMYKILDSEDNSNNRLNDFLKFCAQNKTIFQDTMGNMGVEFLKSVNEYLASFTFMKKIGEFSFNYYFSSFFYRRSQGEQLIQTAITFPPPSPRS